MPFYVVATPIGNLGDITLRALDVLRSIDVVAAEDTRVTKKLLTHFQISVPLISYREQVHHIASKKIISLLQEGKNVALVTDAGTPAISDPGARVVNEVWRAGFVILPIPGPSAVTAALSVAGVNADTFLFLGFPPSKKGRKTFFSLIKNAPTFPVVLYESPHRVMRTLEELHAILGKAYEVIVMKELTKIYEKVIKGSISKVIETLRNLTNGYKIKGEFVIIISKNKKNRSAP